MILHFSDIDRATPYTGKRARYMAILSREGFPIPEGFVISADSYARYMKEIEEELKGMEEGNAGQKASRILSILQNSRYPTDVEAEADKAYKELGVIQNLPKEAARFVMAGREISNVAVRVSGEAELPLVQSFLNLRGTPEITASIRKIFSTVFSRSMLHYKIKRGVPDPVFMENAIIVQKFIPGELFGTVMKHPFDDSKWLIEYCEAKDLFGSLLYGSADPYRLVVDGLSMDIISDPVSNRNDFAGGKYSVRKIIDYAEKAEAALDGKICLEFCVAKDRIWVTGAKPAKDFQMSTSGIVRKRPGNIAKTDIISVDNCNVDIIPFIGSISGVIARHGSYSSRMATICRETGVPFMIKDTDFQDGIRIEIRGGEIAEERSEELPALPSQIRGGTEELPSVDQEKATCEIVEPVLPGESAIAEQEKPHEPKCVAISPRITKLCVRIENLSQLKEASCYDEVITAEPILPSGSGKWMYICRPGDLVEFAKRLVEERDAMIAFEKFEPEKMKEIGREHVALFISTPYEMLKTREISSVASLVIFDIANISRLLANSPDTVFDDVILKQIATAITYFRDHGVECYCSCTGMDSLPESLLKDMVLMGCDGIVTNARDSAATDITLQKAERRILIDLARKSMAFG